MSNVQLNEAITQCLNDQGVKHDGWALLWFDGETVHGTSQMSWSFLAEKIMKVIPPEDLASKVFGMIASNWGRGKK